MFCAAMIAAAAVTDDIMTIIEAGLDEVPENCRLRRDVEKVIAWYREGLDREQIIEKIHETYNENTAHGWCHTISNAMIVTASLLYGEGDFSKSICMAVETGFDTDCNGATVGSILGMANGKDTVSEEWTCRIHNTLHTSIFGIGTVKISDCVEKTLSHLETV
jgi:ADP-ribosylglycohydrolase